MADNKILKSSNEEKNGCCHTAVHFTTQNICIQALRPNHYEEDLHEQEKAPQSEFVKSIIGLRQEEPIEKLLLPNISDCDFNKILEDITNGLSLK